MTNDVNAIWESIQPYLQHHEEPMLTLEPDNDKCKQCKGTNIIQTTSDYVCGDCGLVQTSGIMCSTMYSIDDKTNGEVCNKTSTVRSSQNKLQQMQKWQMWTNEEKNAHKLILDTKTMCQKLCIPDQLVKTICDTTVMVMNTIKKYEGTKRARVKKGIILCCIQYASKGMHQNISAVELAKKIGIEVKYVTNADKLILELVNSKKLQLDKNIFYQTQTPYEHVLDVIRKQSLNIPCTILEKIQCLIDFCEEHDILLDHTPLSIGVCCFYYILMTHNINVDVKIFSELYDLSVVTVLKTFNKLKQYNKHIDHITHA